MSSFSIIIIIIIRQASIHCSPSLSPSSHSHVQLGFATDRHLSKFKHVRNEVKEPFDEVLYMYID